jgi:hypothetical protein
MHVEAMRRGSGRVGFRLVLVTAVMTGAVVGLATTASAAKKPPPNLSAADQALFQYAACMRKKGVNIPDPVKGKDGKYQFPKIPAKVLNAPGVRQKAQACASQLPQTGRAGGGQGSISGTIVSVKGTTFTLRTSSSPTGKSTVSVGSATITEEIGALRSSLKAGACVMATGTRNSKGVVAATRITISAPVNGECGGGFGGRGGATGRTGPPPGSQGGSGQRPPGGFGGNGNVGFAFGAVTKVTGSTLTVKGSFGQTTRTTTVTVSSKTALLRTIRAKASAIKVNLCAFVRGTSNDEGATVKATNIALSPQTNGACTR